MYGHSRLPLAMRLAMEAVASLRPVPQSQVVQTAAERVRRDREDVVNLLYSHSLIAAVRAVRLNTDENFVTFRLMRAAMRNGGFHKLRLAQLLLIV